MSLKQEIRSITYLKSRAADLLDQINRTQRPVVITQNGEARAVLQDPVSYERMREAIGMLKLLVLGEEDVRASRTVSQDEMFAHLKQSLRKRAREHGKAHEV